MTMIHAQTAPNCTRSPSLLRRVRTALAVWRQRQMLADLSPERLRDIGVSAREARAEAEKPIWDVPSFWLR